MIQSLSSRVRIFRCSGCNSLNVTLLDGCFSQGQAQQSKCRLSILVICFVFHGHISFSFILSIVYYSIHAIITSRIQDQDVSLEQFSYLLNKMK